jgi:ATP-dependent DNA helicase DinG
LPSTDDILSAGGPVAAALGPGYEPRSEQLEMARAVARTMESKSHLLVEAGTGVGKSFAYLVPAIQRCLASGQVVVVATNTIALQEQLVERDIPLLHSTVRPKEEKAPPGGADGWSGDLRPVLVKGRGNYMSIRRTKLASTRQDRLFAYAEQKRSWHALEDWAYSTTDGTLSSLPQLERAEVWDHAQSDADNCMGRKCPHFEECFYQRARRKAEKANLLICNHALFFADLALRQAGAGILPKYDHVILDEAHQVEEVASEHLGLSLTEGRVAHLLRTLYDAKRAKGYLDQVRLVAGDSAAADSAIHAALRAGEASREFFDGWAHLVESGRLGTGRVREPGLVDDLLSPAMRDLALRLKTLKDLVSGEADKFELNSYAKRATDIAAAAEALVQQKLERMVYWAELSEGRLRTGRPRVGLACAPVEVGPILREVLFTGEQSVVLTSATLATGGGGAGGSKSGGDPFAHIASRLGCEGAATLLLGSPFEYARQVTLHIDKTMPSPTGGKAPEHRAPGARSYLDELSSRILEHIQATDGGAFVLFTSFQSLNAVADRLRGPLADENMPLLVQGKDGPRGAILAKFREDERSVLLGASSFWQGVDVRGRGLRNVIITRLPFEPPDRPLTEARAELIEQRGGSAFSEDSLPRAIIRFKQGFGRLIRSRTDQGRVVVLDPRIVTVGYGRAFVRALPQGVRVEVRDADSGARASVPDRSDDWPPETAP